MYICRKLLHLEQLQTLQLSSYCTVQPWMIELFVTEVTQGCVLNVCLTSSWRLTEMLHTLQCQFSAQCSPTHITLPCVHDTTRPICRVSLWRRTRKAKLLSHRLGCHASSSSGFLIFRLSMLSAVFLLFCCCLSVQKLDLSTRSLMCALCVRTISVCLLWLKFLGNLWG